MVLQVVAYPPYPCPPSEGGAMSNERVRNQWAERFGRPDPKVVCVGLNYGDHTARALTGSARSGTRHLIFAIPRERD